MNNELEEPPSRTPSGDGNGHKNTTKSSNHHGHNGSNENGSLLSWIKNVVRPKPSPDNLREALEEYIEDLDEGESASIAAHERALISNVLKLRDLTVVDVMVPRADIIAIDIQTSQEDLMALLAEKQTSRIPVYRETLDNIIGTIHIKDILAHLATNKEIKIKELIRDVPALSPAMPVLDLLMEMRQSKKHMAMVVDEFGGIDGLVTIGDVVEAIVGEIDDEFDLNQAPQLNTTPDGGLLADARFDIDEFEERFGSFLTEEEREDVDTLGGLAFALAGRVPARGEVLHHSSGLIFEILDADPRRVSRLRIKNLPDPDA